MTETHEPRTLRDYGAMLRRRRGVIVAITLIAVVIASGLSLTQEKTYSTSATIRVKDVNDFLSQAGIAATGAKPPVQIAAQAAAVAVSDPVIRAVRRQLASRESVSSIESRVSASQDPQSNLISLNADADSAVGAAQLANTTAQQAIERINQTTQDEFSDLAADLRDQADAETGADNQERQTILNTQAARLETLATVAQLAEIVSRADVPDSPASPKPVLNAVVAGIIGLLIGLIVARILESIDRRLRDPSEIQDELGLPLVGVVSDHALGGVPISGAPAEEHIAAMDMFRMLRTNVAFLSADDPIKTVLVTSAVPDEGKTTVATGLSLASAVTGRRTLLIEADVHRPVHADRLGLASAPGLTDLLAGEAEPAEVLQALQFADPGAGQENGSDGTAHATLSCITAGTRAGRASALLSSKRFADLIEEVSAHYDLVVLDTAPALAVAETLEIAPLMDAILYCVRLGQTTLDEARRAIDAIERLPERPTGLVLTDLGAGDSSGYSYYSYSYSYRFGNKEKTSV